MKFNFDSDSSYKSWFSEALSVQDIKDWTEFFKIIEKKKNFKYEKFWICLISKNLPVQMNWFWYFYCHWPKINRFRATCILTKQDQKIFLIF